MGALDAHGSPGPPDLVKPQATESLRVQIRHSLRAALIAGQLREDQTYSAPALARQFGVSITPVREALLDLAHEGLVEPVRNKGFRVVAVNEQDMAEIVDLRLLLEPPTLGRVAGQLDAQQISSLRVIARQIVSSAERGDLTVYLEQDRRFHLELLAHSGNGRLVELVDRLRAQTRLRALNDLAERGTLAESAHEHLELLDAIASGDREATERIAREHLEHARGIWAGKPEAHA